MIFDIEQYNRAALVVPLIIAIFFVCIFLDGLIHFVKLIKANNQTKRDLLIFLLSFLMIFIFWGQSFGVLLNGGMYLFFENSGDAVCVEGEITEIEDLSQSKFPKMKTKYGYDNKNGVMITVNGVKCQAPTRGKFEVGDTVKVYYLPRSRYVLSIFPASET